MSRLFAFAIVCFSLSVSGFAIAQSPGPGNLQSAVDINPADDIFEVNLTAQVTKVDLTGEGLWANAYTYNGLTPGPQIRVQVGDTVIVHFRNEIPEPMNVHWHGIELDNEHDGTSVTQNPVPEGGMFTYKFKAIRPGVFWYHPHAMPTNTEFKGLYGSLIVDDPNNETLVEAGVLPPEDQTFTMMLSDTTVCKAPGENDQVTFAPGADVPWVFTESIGPFPGNVAFPTPKDLCDTPRDRNGKALETGPLAAGDIPNIQPVKNCGSKRNPCRVNEGQLVLTNGRVAAARAGTPETPGTLAPDAEPLEVAAGSGVRLLLTNAAVSRYFRLILTDESGRQIPLHRVGGQGGLLDRARLEGGMIGTLDAKYGRGEIVLSNAQREDIVFVIPPDQKVGEVLTLWTLDFQHYGTAVYPFGYAPVPTVPVAHFKVGAPVEETYQLAEGDPIRMHELVNQPIENIRDLVIEDRLLDPSKFDPPRPGMADEELLFTVVGLRESIDGVHGTALSGSGGDYKDIPHIPTSRYARVGDLLELKMRNGTQMHHPMHLHGFSFQPVRLEDSVGEIVYEYDYNEFVDTVDIPSTHALVFRVHLEDRAMIDGSPNGGAEGRWLLHCHIFNHSALGMITELVVLKDED